MLSLSESLIRKNRNIDINSIQIDEIKNFIFDNYRLDMGWEVDIKKIEPFLDIKNINGEFIVNVLATGLITIFFKNGSSLTNNLFKWGRVEGEFVCVCNTQLKSLEGAPDMVYGFNCSMNPNLTSLKGCPKACFGLFDCNGCKSLKSLKYSPEQVNGDFSCCFCEKLTDLKGAPKYVGGNFVCNDCPRLKSLEGCPDKIKGNLLILNTPKIKSLKGVSKVSYIVVDDYDCIEDYENLENKVMIDIE